MGLNAFTKIVGLTLPVFLPRSALKNSKAGKRKSLPGNDAGTDNEEEPPNVPAPKKRAKGKAKSKAKA